MKKLKFVLASAIIIFTFSSCKKNGNRPKNQSTTTTVTTDSVAQSTNLPVGDNSQVSVDWVGEYEGILPCADCPGLKTSLELNKNNTYEIEEEYLERKTENKEKGTFEWDASGGIITLHRKDGNTKYRVGENQLIGLDTEGKPIDGPLKDSFVLKKKLD